MLCQSLKIGQILTVVDILSRLRDMTTHLYQRMCCLRHKVSTTNLTRRPHQASQILHQQLHQRTLSTPPKQPSNSICALEHTHNQQCRPSEPLAPPSPLLPNPSPPHVHSQIQQYEKEETHMATISIHRPAGYLGSSQERRRRRRGGRTCGFMDSLGV